MLNTMGFDRFTFTVTLVNEFENEEINRRSLNDMVQEVDSHPKDDLQVCQRDLFWTGRCWCDKPLFRYHDQFGKVDVVFL